MLDIEWSEEFCTLTLARPEKRNSLTRQMYEMINDSFHKAAVSKTIKALILRAKGDFFCAGHDLSDFLTTELDNTHPLLDFLKILENFPKYLIVALNGSAIGIGATLLLHADFIIAKKNIYLQTPFISLGLCAEAGSSQLLERVIGRNKARQMLLLGKALPIEECHHNFVTSLVDNMDMLLIETQNLMAHIETLPLTGILANKDLMRFRGESLLETIKREIHGFSVLVKSPETQKIIAAKLAK